MKNLFVELHEARVEEEGNRFGTGSEDLFTEQLAFYLDCNPEAASRLAGALPGRSEVDVSEVELQPLTEDHRPDLVR